MKKFMDDNFLLQTETAQDLYHNHAAKMPIIDYHCHLIPEMVANDHRFKSHHGAVARRRPLQMARHAYQRHRRALLHR